MTCRFEPWAKKLSQACFRISLEKKGDSGQLVLKLVGITMLKIMKSHWVIFPVMGLHGGIKQPHFGKIIFD